MSPWGKLYDFIPQDERSSLGRGGGERGERQREREREESGLRGLRVQTKGSLDSGFAPQVCRSMVLGVSALVTVVFKELIQGN